MEQNVFYLEELNSARPPGNGNNCNGHNRSIQAGGNGHWVGDSCGCEGGVLPNGKIVDRRYYPEATPIQKNSIFGTAKPKTNE